MVLDLLRLRVPVRGVLHPDRYLRRDYDGDVLLPALQRRLSLVRAYHILESKIKDSLFTMDSEWPFLCYR